MISIKNKIVNNLVIAYGTILCLILAFFGEILSIYIGVTILKFDKSPISSIMLSILLGLLFGNIFNLPIYFNNGIEFCAKILLKCGIILLGIKFDVSSMINLGGKGLPLIILCISGAIVVVLYLSKLLNISLKMSVLIAVGTSICGSTAIVAAAPAINAEKEEVTYAIANITLFGIISMFIYPYISHYIFDSNELAIGLFLGTSIHETAQVSGAALIYSDQYESHSVIDIATITKLVRNVSMLIVIPIMSYFYNNNVKNNVDKRKISLLNIFPYFIIGFLIMGIIRSIGDYTLKSSSNQFAFGIISNYDWISLISLIQFLSDKCLAISMASVGLSTNLKSFNNLGIKPFYVGFSAAISVGLISYFGINLLIM